MDGRSGSAARGARMRRGHAAEMLALAHLQRHGLSLVARNFRARGGEIDLVMRDGGVLVFVEVRSRRTTSFMHPRDSIDAGKQQRLIRAAQRFLQCHPRCAALPCRFDAVLLSGPMCDPEIRWIRQAFEA